MGNEKKNKPCKNGCNCTCKTEPKESMGADAAGSFSGNAFSGKGSKVTKLHNAERDIKEVTDASSSGAYDAPFGSGSKNPLKIDGVKSIKNSRAVKDKNFPKWGGPESVYVQVKEKCKKFPYCNGDINALELLEVNGLVESVKEVANEYDIPYKEMEKIVLNEIKKIFIK
jgi:hypothetical protein